MIDQARKLLGLPTNMRWFEWLWLGLPISVWFSYQPLIRLGQSETMYFELSISVIYLAIVACASLPLIWQARRKLMQNRAVWLSGAYVLACLISLIWTPNFVRGVLTCGIAGMLMLTLWGMLARPESLVRLKSAISRVFIAMTVLMSGVGLGQFFAGIWLNSDITMLCAGCQAMQFGFVRPNGFTVEPQFFGGLLVTGIFLLMHEIITKKRTKWSIWVMLILAVVALVLTLSRGAIFSLLIGGLVFAVVNYRQWQRVGLIVISGIGSLAIALVLQGWATSINPTIDETFAGAITKSVNQLSMGVIDVEIDESTGDADFPVSPAQTVGQAEPTATIEPTKTEPEFDGYVEESTNIRLNLSQIALEAWARDTTTQIVGVGTGGAGVAMHQTAPERIAGPREIVQNEYIEQLLEGGIIKLGLFVVVVTTMFIVTCSQKWLWAMIIACLVQLAFFSGYPNALHIYLMLIIVTAITLHRDQLKPAKQYS